MADQIFDSVFGRAATQGTDGSSIHDLPGQTAIGRLCSLIFDNLHMQAGSGTALNGWRVEVLTLPLTRPSRRRVRVTLRGQIYIVCGGQARVSVSCESRRASAELIARNTQALPTGELPSQERSLNLSLTLARSSRPRKLIRILMLLEGTAETEAAQVEATIDSIEIEAL